MASLVESATAATITTTTPNSDAHTAIMQKTQTNNKKKMKKTGYVFEEVYMWHNPGTLPGSKWTEPCEFWENPDTKRRFHNLLAVSGLLDKLVPVRAVAATKDQITRFHNEEYHDRIVRESALRGGEGGDMAPFSKGGYEIAALSAGGVLQAVEAVVSGKIDNAYCLVRPPGHHAVRDMGMGFCLFNNIALAALHARTLTTVDGKAIKRVAIVDYDVHHGNGTQQAFYEDAECLFISLHQDNNYPQGCGSHLEHGGVNARGFNINIPLPAGCGHGAYELAFESIVLPSLRRFQPDLILVSSGFDASFADPLSAMMLHSDSYRYFATSLCGVAEECCGGRIVFAHEGGYSKDYVPFCGLAVIEAMSGIRTEVEDHYLCEATQWGGQMCQPHQRVAINNLAVYNGFTPLTSSSSSSSSSSSNSEKCSAGGGDGNIVGGEEDDTLSEVEIEIAMNIQSTLLHRIQDSARRKKILDSISI